MTEEEKSGIQAEVDKLKELLKATPMDVEAVKDSDGRSVKEVLCCKREAL